MTDLRVHDETTAPEAARATLAAARKSYGLLPNLLGVFAENPAALEAYVQVSGQFAKSGLSALEQQIVAIAVSVENACHFCVAAHSAVAARSKLPADVIAALRDGRPLADRKLEALRSFTLRVVRERGFVADADVQSFLAAGYTKADLLAVLLGVTMKTLSNYTNHIAATPLNKEFEAFAWSKKVPA